MTVKSYKNPKYVAELFNKDYQSFELLGYGATGAVYKCWNKRLQRSETIKIFPYSPNKFEHDALCKYLQFEISHPNLIKIIHGNRLKHYFYYIMECVEGETLKQRIARQGKLPPEMAETILFEILNGLSYLHGKDLRHRDLKSENILIDKTEKVVICDIGLMKEQHGKTTLSKAGTHGYMAPENKFTNQSDLYSVGKILCEMLIGKLLDYSEIDSCPDLSDHHKLIIKKAIESNPDKRFSSADEFKKELLSPAPAVSRQSVEDKPLKYATHPKPVSLVDTAARVDNHVEAVPPKKHKVRWAMLIVAIVAIGAVYFAMQSSFLKLDGKKSSSNENRNSHAISDNTQSENITRQNIDLNLPMALIPAGTFMMGSPGSDAGANQNEKPQHQVTVSKAFQMGKHEITNAQYCEFLNEDNGSHYYLAMSMSILDGIYKPTVGKENFPVVYVNWNDAKAYCDWLSKKTGQVYRLPTEAEWEYACRAGTTTSYYWGDKYESSMANCKTDIGALQAVGTYPANSWGLCDMSGNAEEWCADWHGDYSSGSTTDPTGPSSGTTRILRGGGFDDSNQYARCAGRSSTNSDNRNSGFGIRVVKEVKSNASDLSYYLDMVSIKSGIFMMGSPDSDTSAESEEKPQHQVTLSAFEIGKYEITNAQFCAFLNDGHSKHHDSGMKIVFSGSTYTSTTGYEKHPVIYVSWNSAKAYCDWLSSKTGQIYRLPTEAEWEYACRAGTTTKYYWGDTFDSTKANNNGTGAVVVGSFPANPWGLYDMNGNVSEWCADWYNETYYSSSPPNNPTGPTLGMYKVYRGDAWDSSSPNYRRSANRSGNSITPDYKNYPHGFRVVKGAIPTEVTDDRLVAHWKFDETGGTTASDSSRNNNVGELHGGNWVAGVKGNAISLNGKSDFVEVQDSKSLDLTTSGTIALWVKIDRDYVKSGCGPGLVSKGEGTAVGKVAYDLALDSGNQYEGYVHDGNYTDAAKATPVLERWQFLVFTWDSTRIKLYLDGNLVQEKEQVGKGPFVNTFKLYMGKRYYESQAVWGYFKGLLDEVRIYKYALEASDIQRLYNQEKPALQ